MTLLLVEVKLRLIKSAGFNMARRKCREGFHSIAIIYFIILFSYPLRCRIKDFSSLYAGFDNYFLKV